MPDHVRPVGSSRVQDRDRVGDMLLDAERPGCRGWLQAALLEPENASSSSAASDAV